MKRGDVVLVRFLHPSGLRGKKRPAVIVQSLGTLSPAMLNKLDACLKIAMALP